MPSIKTSVDFTLQSVGPTSIDGVQNLKERLEATIQALVEKDMEVIEAYTLLNLMLVGGRPRSQSLLGKLQSGELIAPVDLDLEPIRDDLAYTRKIAFSFLMLGSAIGRLSRRPLIGVLVPEADRPLPAPDAAKF